MQHCFLIDLQYMLQAAIDRRDKQLDSWVEWHEKTLKKGEVRDFTDIMLTEEGDDKLTKEEIRSIIWDTMAGGIDTSALSFEWLVYILTNYPDVQKKIHDELDRVVGPDRLPTLDDVDKLQYLNATICELFRFKHFAPFGIPHNTREDITLCGYKVPRDTQVMFNLYTLHMDPDLWTDPTRFDPTRFMEGGEAANLQGNYLDTDRVRTKFAKEGDALFKFLPFGFGKRQCAGFGLGRIIMFLKAATHLHCFNWESADGIKASLGEAFGVTLTPKKEHPMKVTCRPAARLAQPCTWHNSDDGMPGVWLQ
jgi:cytochrome P450